MKILIPCLGLAAGSADVSWEKNKTDIEGYYELKPRVNPTMTLPLEAGESLESAFIKKHPCATVSLLMDTGKAREGPLSSDELQASLDRIPSKIQGMYRFVCAAYQEAHKFPEDVVVSELTKKIKYMPALELGFTRDPLDSQLFAAERLRIMKEAAEGGFPFGFSDFRGDWRGFPVNSAKGFLSECYQGHVWIKAHCLWHRSSQLVIKEQVFESLEDLLNKILQATAEPLKSRLARAFEQISNGWELMPAAYARSNKEDLDKSVAELYSAIHLPDYSFEKVNRLVPCLLVYVAETRPDNYDWFKTLLGISNFKSSIPQMQLDLCRAVLGIGPHSLSELVHSAKKSVSRPLMMSRVERQRLIDNIRDEIERAPKDKGPPGGAAFLARHPKITTD